jgi:hypothetical protein
MTAVGEGWFAFIFRPFCIRDHCMQCFAEFENIAQNGEVRFLQDKTGTHLRNICGDDAFLAHTESLWPDHHFQPETFVKRCI